MAAARTTLVWLADAGALSDHVLAAYAGWLGAGERRRHEGFVRAERRRQFLAGRALLRQAFGQLLGVAPAAIALHERPGLAPALASPTASAVGFSISHSGPWVACAVSSESQLGLDIERIDPRRDLLALAEQAFQPDEIERLRACDAQQRSLLFYRMWCEHEARIKLGTAASRIHYFERPGLCGALACAGPLAAAPLIETVSLDLP